MEKRQIDLSSEEKKKEFFDILNGFKCKREAYEYLGVYDNKKGIEYLQIIANEVGFDLNVYKERKKAKTKVCLECGIEFKPSNSSQKFCCRSCSAVYNNRLRKPYGDEFGEKISNS